MEPIENIKRPSSLRGENALAAIVFTDVEAFTPKMAADEKHTIALIERDFQLMGEVCQRFDGQVLKALGDGLLMYFISAERAVSCAIEIQKVLVDSAVNLSPKDVLKHRIGIHLGDVMFSGNDVMGNGVNVAARLQGEAPPGGICISQTVYDVVKSCLPISAIYVGLRQLKGISEPVPVYQISLPRSAGEAQQRVFLSYRNTEPDRSLAQQFYQALTAQGHSVFMAGESIRLGENWAQRIEVELKRCDYLLLLLSEQSATSELVSEQVRRAKELREGHSNDKPGILPIRVNFPMNSPLDYNLRGYLDRIQQREWQSPDHTPVILQELESLLAGGETSEEWKLEDKVATPHTPFPSLDPPLPVAAPELPGGQVELASAFYVPRPPIEERTYEEIIKPGALIRIKAPRQMGKTSLLARILRHAAGAGYRTIPLSFQLADSQIFTDLNRFLQWFCANVALELDLPERLGEYWNAIFGSKVACKSYFERYILAKIATPIVLGLDEVDRVFQYPEIASDFLGLLRAWHEEAKNREIWRRLRLVVVHSTEVYVPMDINQSPFNVGLPVELPEFTQQQVADLAKLHQLNWQAAQVHQLMAMVGGHPYLVRLALYHIARQDLTLDQLLATAPTDAGIYGDHLRRHLWNLELHPELASAVKKVVTATEPVQLESMQGFKLHSMGLVNLQGNQVTPRCQLYCQYFRTRIK